MGKFYIDNSVEKSCRYILSKEFLNWCGFESRIQVVQQSPKVFLTTFVNYIIYPPQSQPNVPKEFLTDAKKCV